MKSTVVSSNLDALPALKVLLRARAEGRMPHAVLLTGPDPQQLAAVAERLAAIHLETSEPIAHADCRVLRPAKRSRTIDVDSVQAVVNDLHLMSVTSRRVVIIHEPDRLGDRAATSFLKTLEEPPAGTLIILQTTHYYSVLLTVLSRCLRFHIGGEAPTLSDASWVDWLREFDKFLGRLAGATPASARSTEIILPLYALCARFEVLLELFVEEALKNAPPPPPTDQDEEEEEMAYEASIRRGIRTRMLIALEECLRLVGRAHPACGLQVAAAVALLEQARSRLELNYPLVAGLEVFLLSTLRVFAARPPLSPV